MKTDQNPRISNHQLEVGWLPHYHPSMSDWGHPPRNDQECDHRSRNEGREDANHRDRNEGND